MSGQTELMMISPMQPQPATEVVARTAGYKLAQVALRLLPNWLSLRWAD
jgi:hypothetical protein